MNMTRKFGIFTIALAAMAAAIPQRSAASGSIRSITPCEASEKPHEYGEENLLRIGDVMAFKVRLLNYNLGSPSLTPTGSLNNPWQFKVHPGVDAAVAQMNPPKLGLWISGHRRYATLNWSMSKLSDDGYYTDLVFEYKAQAGDIAMPVKFCDASGRNEMLAGDRGSIIYNFENVGTYWDLQDAAGHDCPFYWGSTALNTGSTDPYEYPPPAWTSLLETYDPDLSQAKIYIRTIDFDTVATEVWRTVYENKSTTADGNGLPAIAIPGGADDDCTVYVWTEDSNVAILANGSEKVYHSFTPGETAGERTAKDYTVYTANILKDTSVFNFKVKGVFGAAGQETDIYISTTPTNIYNSAGTLIHNFIKQKVAVVAQANPEVLLSIDTTDLHASADYGLPKARLTVSVDAYTNDVQISLNPKVGGVALEEGHIGISTSSDGALSYLTGPITVPATASMDVEPRVLTYYIFGLGYATNSTTFKTTATSITFAPTITGDDGKFGAIDPLVFTLKEDAPVISLPASSEEIYPTAKEEYPLTINIQDSWANLMGVDSTGYDVWWKKDKTSAWALLKSGVVANADGELEVNLKYTSGGEFETHLRVTGPDGQKSAEVLLTAYVATQKRAVLSVDRDGDEDMPRQYFEGEKVQKVRIKLENWKNDTGDNLYAFLEPADADTAANVVNVGTGAKFITTSENCKGLLIPADGTQTQSASATFRVLDGDLQLNFNVVIRDTENWSDPDAKTIFTDEAEVIEALNAEPVIASVMMSGAPELTQGDGSETIEVNKDLKKTFTWVIDDVDADLLNTVKPMKTIWTVYRPNGAQAVTQTFTGDPSDPDNLLKFQYTFNESGKWKISVKAQDKDMGSKDYSEFVFNVLVGDVAKTGYAFPEGVITSEDNYEYEVSESVILGGKFNWIQVGLNTAATDPITIKVTHAGSAGKIKFEGEDETGAVTVTIPAGYDINSGSTVGRIYFTDLDGTSNPQSKFTVTATVITTDPNPDGIPYSTVYKPTPITVRVLNSDPVTEVTPEDGVTNIVSANESISIKWTTTDVPSDTNNNLINKFSGLKTGCYEYVSGSETSASGEVSFYFTGSGTYTVSFMVYDKDSGRSVQYKWYYVIKPSKDATVCPLGPSTAQRSDKSRDYQTAAGIGKGRVYSDSGEFTAASAFRQAWSFTMATVKVPFFAVGYEVGQVDNGSLSGFDIALDKNGNNRTGVPIADYYKYSGIFDPSDENAYDSFFYAWVNITSDEQGGNQIGTAYLAPQNGKGVIVEKTFSLPTEALGDEENPSYDQLVLDAVFSREMYPADNLGDINMDGVPDWFAVKKYDQGYLYQLAAAEAGGEGQGGGGSGESQGGGVTDNSDLKSVAGYNGDEDFLPKVFSNPRNEISWAPDAKFTARMEVRGFGEGLNVSQISDPDLTKAEAMALECAFAAAKAQGKLSANDFADAASWMKAGYWTCENRTDPTMEDTDEDGIPDGYEYYIWYYATCGDMVGNSWWRLTGSKFNRATIGQGEFIPSEVLAQAFNPTKPRAEIGMTEVVVNGKTYTYDVKDFDGDGLSDIEEIAIGTSPITWDTDRDGVSDYYEVLMGTDPLNAVDGDRSYTGTDNANNPDCDFMAWLETDADFTVVAGTLADGTEQLYAFKSAPQFEASEDDSSAWNYSAVSVEDGVTYFFQGEPITAVDAEGNVRLAVSTIARAGLESDGAAFIGAADTVLPAGTLFEAAPEAVAEVVPFVKVVSGDEQPVRVFRYGTGSNEKFVPAPLDGVTGEDVPADFAVSDILPEQSLLYIHHQVFQVAGFDPRTAWSMDNYGYVSSRWRAAGETAGVDASIGLAGYAVNTAPFTTLDEFLLARYRYEVYSPFYDESKDITDDPRFEFRAKRNVADDANMLVFELFWGSRPDLYQSGASVGATTVPVAELTKTNMVNGELKSTHFFGADTDGDGIPDGWELYTNIDPTYYKDATFIDLACTCQDDMVINHVLTFLQNYAGTDSCNAYDARSNAAGEEIYPNVESITSQHPGRNTGWYNKFFPSNPYETDTDGDGLLDIEEGQSWRGEFHVGRSSYRGCTHRFIYGPNDGKPAEDADDGTSVCIRGGGLNPCSVDTDRDLLPDAWEYEFAGVVFEEGECKSTTLSTLDRQTICVADGLQGAYDETSCCIRGGMDGTDGKDHSYDFDHDGLLNFQEYLVQSLRHLRYDDCETPLMGHVLNNATWTLDSFVSFLPMQTFDGQDFFQRCQAAGFAGTSAYNFEKLGYFVLPKYEWDPMRIAPKGIADCKNYGDEMSGENCGYRYMFRPYGLTDKSAPDSEDRSTVRIGSYYSGTVHMYASTDPRQWDSDGDGMDDYYELFHGLNPLLGSAEDPEGKDSYGESNLVTFDRIALIYAQGVEPPVMTAWRNAWTAWGGLNFGEDPTMKFDAIRFPWMMGTAEADADGDGLRNNEEALMVNITSPSPTHTDPTPLWYTDSTSTNYLSYVSQYYAADPYQESADIFAYPWDWNANTILKQVAVDGVVRKYKFAFEENEGFDTDGDGVPDKREIVKTVTDLSDPIDGSDPNRRQAMYFPGWNEAKQRGSAVVSYTGGNRPAISTEYDMLRQFTVETWVKPESAEGEQTILERVSNYGASTLSNNTAIVKANFRLGIRDGRFFGEYEGSAADSGYARVSGSAVATNRWTHLALTYNGESLILYENGDPDYVDIAGSHIQPANGITIFRQEAGDLNFSVNEFGYTAVPCATVLGASVNMGAGIALGAETTWDSYGKYFAGYVDEVRIWDGARSSGEIHADFMKSYAMADIAAIREDVFDAWSTGARRNNTLATEKLPAELLADYSFRNIPGAVRAVDVSQEPVGFTDGVILNARVDGGPVPGGIGCGWWASLPVRSSVYGNVNIVPWIRNEVGHLPLLDGSVIDSQYWSAGFAGVQEAAVSGVATYSFPNSSNPYPYYNYLYDRYWHLMRLNALVERIDGESAASSNTEYSVSQYLKRYEFELRRGFVGVTDLVPLGGAFAQRSEDMWDGIGAADAWEYTGLDSDADGLPDWWEELYVGELATDDANDWDKLVDYHGDRIPAWEAYRRDLAAGMLPTATSKDDKLVAYRATIDVDGNGILDWWEKLYDVFGQNALEDGDNDGLSNFAEYLIGQCFSSTNFGVYAFPGNVGFPRIDPSKMRTYSEDGQLVPDYFLRVGNLYLGEMFGDHDFMEDWWESQYSVLSAFSYDANKDPDGDGWSNFAERRASTSPERVSYLGVDEMTIPDYPVPTVEMTVSYNGTRSVSTAPVVVQAWRADDAAGIPDAIWKIAIAGETQQSASKGASGGTSANNASSVKEKLVGMNPNREITLTLGPGSVVQGSVSLQFKDISWHKIYARTYPGGNEVLLTETAGESSEAEWVRCAIDRVRVGDTVVGDLIDSETFKVIGSINYQTGEARIDLTMFQGKARYNTEEVGTVTDDAGNIVYINKNYSQADLANSYVKVAWNSKMASQAFPRKFYLADSEVPSTAYNCRGHLREGKNLFVAFADLDGNGAYTPGEPYGAVNNIEVGWNRTRPFSIELTDTSASVMRIDLASAIAANDFASQALINDRGVNPTPWNRNLEYENVGAPISEYLPRTRVKIVQTGFNGIYSKKSGTTYIYPTQVVFDKYIDLSVNPVITERDLLADGQIDLDEVTVRTGASKILGNSDILTNAQYRVIIGDNTDSSSTNSSALATMFVNAFEPGPSQSLATPVEPAGDITEIQPTFTWKHTNKIGKAYPAFVLRVFTTDNKEIYNSGKQPAPARDAEGVYSWTAPIYANMLTPQGKLFSTTNNYYWTVSMLDAKFSSANTDATKCYFRVNTSGFGGGIAAEGALGATVKYFGPANMSSNALEKLVRLQAFTTPDFSGDPAGESYVQDLASVSSMSNVDINCSIRGLKKGTYYLRAYIDTNGNCQRDDWESWGYACYVRTRERNLYTPKGVVVDPTVAKLPTAEIYIEDVDTDRDGLPDVWEMETQKSLATRTSPTGNTYLTHVNPALAATIKAYTDLDLYGGFGFTGVYPVMTMMSSSGATLTSIARLMNAKAAVTKPSVEIKSFSMDTGLEIEVRAATTIIDGVEVFDTNVSEVEVRWTLKYKGSLAVDDWDEVATGTVMVPANGGVRVLPATFDAIVKEKQLNSAGFFKVDVEVE